MYSNTGCNQRVAAWDDAPEPFAEIVHDKTLSPDERLLLIEALFVHDSEAGWITEGSVTGAAR